MNESVRLLFACVVGASFLLGACGDGSNNGTTTEEDPAAEETQDAEAGTGSELMITAFDFGFREEEPTVATGDVALSFRNTGKAPHTFTIEALAVDESAGGGETVEATFTAEAGTYEFICSIHPQMTGELVVE